MASHTVQEAAAHKVNSQAVGGHKVLVDVHTQAVDDVHSQVVDDVRTQVEVHSQAVGHRQVAGDRVVDKLLVDDKELLHKGHLSVKAVAARWDSLAAHCDGWVARPDTLEADSCLAVDIHCLVVGNRVPVVEVHDLAVDIHMGLEVDKLHLAGNCGPQEVDIGLTWLRQQSVHFAARGL